MNCPDCNGPMWDNRPKKANGTYKPNRADFSCKDKDGCGKGVWLDKAAGATNGGGAANQNGSRPNDSRPLGPLYNECLDFAKKAMSFHFGAEVPTSDIVAATATLFIQAAKTGGTIRKAKEAPAPPAPPPQPAQRSAEEDLPY